MSASSFFIATSNPGLDSASAGIDLPNTGGIIIAPAPSPAS
jgi:hypothetical protein